MIKTDIDRYYNKWWKKKKAGDDKAKAMMNYVPGCWQNRNPFLRAYIVNSCNKRMEKLIDKNTLMVNTDAIYSSVQRTDIPIGDGLGEFKMEHTKMRIKGLEYQKFIDGKWDTSYRGIPKIAFKEDWNILTDNVPAVNMIWNFNKNEMRLEL